MDYAPGPQLLLPTELLHRLGGLDKLHTSYYEDTDLAFRVRSQGLKVCLQPASVVVHHEGLSHGRDPSAGGKAESGPQPEHFRRTLAGTLEREQLPPGAHAFLARDGSQLKKSVLVIERHAPKQQDAGSRAIWRS